MNNQIDADIRCPYCKVGFEINIELEEEDLKDFETEDSSTVDFDEIECPHCENTFNVHGTITKNEDTLSLVINAID